MLARERYPHLLLGIAVVSYWLLSPAASASAADCWTGSLKVLVNEKENRTYGTTSGEQGNFSSALDAEGQVLFYVDKKGHVNTINKSVRGSSLKRFSRDTGCRQYQATSVGVLKEGIISKGKRLTAFWQVDTDAQTTVRNEKGCMQEPTRPLHSSEQIEDSRFEAIVHPGLFKLRSLCEMVKKSAAGYCHADEKGFSGQLTFQSGWTETVQAEAHEVYEWEAVKTQCDCEAEISLYRGDVKVDGTSITEKGPIKVAGSTITTGNRSRVKIEINNVQLNLGSNSEIDLSDICPQTKAETTIINLVVGKIWAFIENPAGKPIVFKPGRAASGVRGDLHNYRVMYASLGIATMNSVILTGQIEGEEDFLFDEAGFEKAGIVFHVDYNPERRYLLIETRKGMIKLRDSSGYERFLREGERLYKSWQQDTPEAEFKEIEIIAGATNWVK